MNEISQRKGYRGYIGSRRYFGERTPQHVQNLVVRDFCQRHGFNFLLSHTEYIMKDSFMMLEETLLEAPELDGIVLFSLYMLPDDKKYRQNICRRIREAGTSLHCAVENKSFTSDRDFESLEDLWTMKLQMGDGMENVVTITNSGQG